MSSDPNPYRAPASPPNLRPSLPSFGQLIITCAWSIAFFYPLIAIGSIYLTHFMHDVLQMRGATIRYYGSPMGIVFNLSVYVLIGVPFVSPLGLVGSFFPPRFVHKATGKFKPILPLGFIAIACFVIVLVFLDPWRVVEIYLD